MNGLEESMTERYICTECKEISSKKRECPICEKRMKKVALSSGLERWVPYLMAGSAALLLGLGFLFDVPFLTWLTFPLIGAGLLFDHLYQKQVDEAIKEMI